MHTAWTECSPLVQEVVLVHLVNLRSIIFMEMVILVLGAHRERRAMRIIIRHRVEMKIIQPLVTQKLRLLNRVCKDCR